MVSQDSNCNGVPIDSLCAMDHLSDHSVMCKKLKDEPPFKALAMFRKGNEHEALCLRVEVLFCICNKQAWARIAGGKIWEKAELL